MNHLAENLQALRKARGYTQEQAAEMLEVSRQAVSKWESGQATPEMDKLVLLTQLYRCTLDELIKGETPPASPDEKAFRAYNESWDRLAQFVSGGAAMILAGVALLMLFTYWLGEESLVGVGAFLSLTFLAAFGIVYAALLHGQMVKKYPQVPDLFSQEEREAEDKAFIRGICLGLALIFLGVLALLFLAKLFPELLAGAVMMALLSGGTGCIVHTAIRHGKYNVSEYIKEQSGQSHWTQRAGGAIMLLATAVFLLMGFGWNLWHPGWAAFPIGGILCAVVDTLGRKDQG